VEGDLGLRRVWPDLGQGRPRCCGWPQPGGGRRKPGSGGSGVGQIEIPIPKAATGLTAGRMDVAINDAYLAVYLINGVTGCCQAGGSDSTNGGGRRDNGVTCDQSTLDQALPLIGGRLGVPMGTPNTSIETSDDRGSLDAHGLGSRATVAADPLADIGAVMAALKQKDALSAENAAHVLEGRQAFFDEFRAVCQAEVRPAMQAVLDRLRQEGGDGLIEEHPGGEPRVSTPRLTLWMSLQGPIDNVPRQDRNPYLQLDADVVGRVIRVSEGDSWRGRGAGHSGSVGTWKPTDVTRALVVQELAEIVRRSARVSDA
jgi:hypothetical protein